MLKLGGKGLELILMNPPKAAAKTETKKRPAGGQLLEEPAAV